MSLEGGVNPVNGTVRAELHVQSTTVNYYRDPPPPYSVSIEDSVVTSAPQPVIHQSVIQATLGNGPTLYTCPQCNQRVLTNIIHVTSQKTHLLAGFICGLTCWCLLCCLAAIPYMVTSFKATEHYCPYCKMFLGKSTKR